MIKKASILFILSFSIALYAGFISSPENVKLDNNCIVPLEKTGKILFFHRFQEKNSDWRSYNSYQDKIAYSFETMDGEPALVLRNKEKSGGDTAWKMTSRTIQLHGGEKQLLFEINCKANSGLMQAQVGKGQWKSAILWYGKGSKLVKETPLRFTGNPACFTTSQMRVDVPDGAISFVLLVGADAPDIRNECYEAYRFVRLSDVTGEPDFTGSGSFFSAPFVKTRGNISWTGVFSEDTVVGLQLSFAPDANGIPGKWSAFVGPDGKESSYYRNGDILSSLPADAQWMCYKLQIQNGPHAYCVKSVTVGDFKDGNWGTPCDAQPPIVVNLTEISDNPKKEIKIRIIDESPIDWQNVQISLDGQDVSSQFSRQGDCMILQPDTPFENRMHTIAVRVSDTEGNMTTTKRYFSLVPKPQKNLVSLRDDGITLIDGQPFFPIGIMACNRKPWNQNSYDIACRDIKAAGFNLTHTYRFERNDVFYQEFLPAVEKHGLKIFISGPKGANSKDTPAFLKTVQKELHNSSILSWYVADDTAGFNTNDQIAELTDQLRFTDPSRITSQADAATGFPGFANMTHVFMPEIYPVLSEDDEKNFAVARVISDMEYSKSLIRREGNPNTAVWALLQYFKGWKRWMRYPTPVELRAMTFAAVVSGAQGLVWYTYAPGDHENNFGAAASPENWAIMTEIAQEINLLAPVLCERTPDKQPEIEILSGPQKDDLGHSSIHGLLKIHNGKYYYLVVNSARSTVKASFSIPGVSSGIEEKTQRKISMTKGKFSDDFAPYAVHVYELQ